MKGLKGNHLKAQEIAHDCCCAAAHLVAVLGKVVQVGFVQRVTHDLNVHLIQILCIDSICVIKVAKAMNVVPGFGWTLLMHELAYASRHGAIDTERIESGHAVVPQATGTFTCNPNGSL